MLSEKTLAEMKAGAEQVAIHANKTGVDPEYMEAMIRTQQRAAWLKKREAEGKIEIVRTCRPNPGIDKHVAPVTIVKVGDELFDDPNGELVGAWPSEVLVARVALALGAQGE
jgi:hypothetical protein